MAPSMVILAVLMALLGMSSASVYKVDWNDESIVDYETWASTKTFHVGDVILFKYDAKKESVARVTHKNFRLCNATDPIAVMASGTDYVSIKSTHAHLYFISTVPGLCETGQKVDIRVSQPSSHHSPAPIAAVSPSSSSSPAPAPGPTSSAAEPSLQSKARAFLAMLALGVVLS